MNKLMIATTVALMAGAGCNRVNNHQTHLEELQRTGADATPTPGTASPAQAKAQLQTAPGTNLKGSASFSEHGEGVRVSLSLENAPPGKHGVHIHEKGDCSDIPGKSMGEHFAPRGHQHGLPTAAQRHLGDLGNIDIDDQGRGQLDISAAEAKLARDHKMSFLGKAIVVHAGEDTGQGTSGESGPPIACGVIDAT